MRWFGALLISRHQQVPVDVGDVRSSITYVDHCSVPPHFACLVGEKYAHRTPSGSSACIAPQRQITFPANLHHCKACLELWVTSSNTHKAPDTSSDCRTCLSVHQSQLATHPGSCCLGVRRDLTCNARPTNLSRALLDTHTPFKLLQMLALPRHHVSSTCQAPSALAPLQVLTALPGERKRWMSPHPTRPSNCTWRPWTCMSRRTGRRTHQTCSDRWGHTSFLRT